MKSDVKYDPFASIDEALDIIRSGGMLICTDDEDRENEGDLIMAAESITPEAVNFMTKYGRGLVCTPMTINRATELGLEPMTQWYSFYRLGGLRTRYDDRDIGGGPGGYHKGARRSRY